jgi:hypothetical protein
MGIPALVSSAMPSGTVRLINANGIAANADTIRFDASEDASLAMTATPSQDSTTGTGETMVSLFQTHAVCLLARTMMGAELLRSNAVSELTSVAWGTTGS